MISVMGWMVMGMHLLWSGFRMSNFKVPGKVLLLIWFCAFWTLTLDASALRVFGISLIYSGVLMFAPDDFFSVPDPDKEEDHVFAFPGQVVGVIFMAGLAMIPYVLFQFVR